MRMDEIFEGLGVSLEVLEKHAADVARHARAVEREEAQALSVPVEELTLRARRELGQDERTEDELLTLRVRDAQRRAKRAVELGSKPDTERQAAAERKKRREFEALLAQAFSE